MRGSKLCVMSLLCVVAFHAQARGSYDCNADHKQERCLIRVEVLIDSGRCTAVAPDLNVFRHENNKKIALIWFLDDGSGSAPRWKFDRVDGVAIYDWAGVFDKSGRVDDDKFKWVDRHIPHPQDPFEYQFFYDITVLHRENGRWVVCDSKDPVIVNKE